MMAGLVIAARFIQFAGAVILFGSPLFFLYGRPASGVGAPAWRRPLLVGAGLFTALGTVAALLGQTSAMAGDPAAAFDLATVWSVLSGTQFGLAAAVRFAAAFAALLAMIVWPPSRRLWIVLAALGAVVVASFAWTGHGAADDGIAGLAHLGADVLHLLAAGVWLGALAALLLQTMTSDPGDPVSMTELHRGLAGFAGVGSVVVAALVLTGLVNSWFLVGPDHLAALASSTYGLLLVTKVAVFAAMLGLAAMNRFRLTPRLARDLAGHGPAAALGALRRSLLVETAAGVLVLILVGVLGAIAPLSAQ